MQFLTRIPPEAAFQLKSTPPLNFERRFSLKKQQRNLNKIFKMYGKLGTVINCLVISLLSALMCVSAGRGLDHVTCGSVLKLMNTAYKVRLHSHDIKYGSGSGQQSVTGSELKEDVNSMWAVKGSSKLLPCKRGEPVKCGTKLRLEHLQTGRNLHSHLFSSPLSNQQEISAFGEEGEGDTGDVWEVVCDGTAWERDDAIRFRHIDTDTYLAASGNTYGRPIHGQMEIVGVTHSDSTSYWKAMEGVFIHPSESNGNGKHDEL